VSVAPAGTETLAAERLARRIRLAAVLVVLGLLFEALSFVSLHAVAFFAFLAPGALLVVVGIAIFLWSIASVRT